jgi:hypothetical protein
VGLADAILLTAIPALIIALLCVLRWKEKLRQRVSPWASWLTGVTFATLLFWAVNISFSSVIANCIAIFVACLCFALFLHAIPKRQTRRYLLAGAWAIPLLALPYIWWGETRYAPDYFPSQQIILSNGDSCRLKDEGGGLFGPHRVKLSVFRPLPVVTILERRIASTSVAPEKEARASLSDTELCETARRKAEGDSAES